ncbi:NAD(P)H-binding protein [Planctomonas sp. JC2975]|uniref:SDR family oxidoreductase n=1 Tax=Planctomonas sp. JC2975 TaxID=2729626 RepID=UPI001473B923|nr:NAD(P)H-binding protein [Planctomonas sp. JC2975]NNC13887.1 NAD(P)H-binding protein [Planctomonas sp. JC2975]
MDELVVVAGATGYVGRHLVEGLDARGYRVRALVRSRDRAEKPGAFGAPSLSGHVAEWRIVDFEAPETIEGVCEGADRVVSALGVTRQKASPWQIDFRGNLAVLADAEKHALASFAYVNVLHSDAGDSMTMRSKFAFAQALSRSRVTPQIVNPSGYFSDMTDFLRMAQRGMGFTMGSGSTKVNPIHGADLASFIVDRVGGAGGAWDVGGPDTFTYRQLEELAFRVAGRTPHILRVGEGVGDAMTWLADRGSPRLGNLTRFFVESLTVDAVGTPIGERHLEPYLRSVA